VTGAVLERAGSAVRWRAVQLGGIEVIYFTRLIILAAMLAPDVFGLLAIASIALSTLMRISDVGMVPALVHHHEATLEQHDAAWTVGLTRAALVTSALVVSAPLIASLFDEPRATRVIQAFALRPFIEAMGSIGVAGLMRELRFRELAFMNLPGAVVDLVVAVSLAPKFGVWALVAGTLAGSITMVMLSYALAPHRPRLRFRWSEIVPLVEFGRWVLAAGIVTLAGTLLTQLAVSRLLGAAALGIFFLAVKLAFLPIDASNSLVGAVAFPMFARARTDPNESTRLFVAVFTGMYLLMLPVLALIFTLVPELEPVLGPKWSGTAPIVRILCIAAMGGIAATVLDRYLLGHGDARGAFRLEALNTVVTLTVLLPGVMVLQLHGAAASWLLGGLSTFVFSLWLIRRRIPGALSESWRRLGAAVVVALSAAATAGWVATHLTGLPALLAGGLAGVASGALVLWWQNAALGLRLGEFIPLLSKRSEYAE